MPAIGTPASRIDASRRRYCRWTSTIRGSTARGMPNSLEQRFVPVERRKVHQLRAAGVGDVGDMQAAARAAGQVPDQPAVDRAEEQVAAFGRRARAGHVVEQPLQFQRAEVARQRQTGASRGSDRRRRRARSSSQTCGRRACPATPARCAPARPVRRSHSTVVSRWLVMPMAARSLRGERAPSTAPRPSPPGCCARSPAHRVRPSPVAGRCCACSRWRWRDTSPAWLKRMQRVLVVPWSRAAMKREGGGVRDAISPQVVTMYAPQMLKSSRSRFTCLFVTRRADTASGKGRKPNLAEIPAHRSTPDG